MKIFAFVALVSTVSAFDVESSLGHLKTKADPATQALAVFNLIQRLIPDRVENFVVEIDPNLHENGKDMFKLESLSNNVVKITGTTGVAAATGFNYYLKYFLNCHVSWEASQLNIPKVLPTVQYTNVLNDKFRYYQNVCTTSYSFVWWTWNDWEKHIDWMAMNSFNLVLAFNGQEAIWQRVYKKLNLTQREIDEQFSGPAFLSWQRMGNLRGWGGPLSDSWHERSLRLQKRILSRMRELGIIPILPSFSGYVPKALKRIYPDANLVPMKWNRFNETYQAYLLDPFAPHFQAIGDMFMEEMMDEFGTDNVYSSDTFNEVIPPSTDLAYIKKAGQAVYEAMSNKDPKAIWVMQNWLFVNAFVYWTPNRAKALLTSVPKGKMIVLDLQSEQFPQYERFQSYYGQPYIWCMLHNFGGTLGMFGSTQIINKRPFDARNKNGSTMVGTGLTPEGINQNYVVYELMAEMAFRRAPVDLPSWFKEYAKRRYGRFEANSYQAWSILMPTVYSFPGAQRVRGKYTMTISPNTKIAVKYWYYPCDVYRAWDHLLQAADTLRDSSGYRHDLVDLTRQVIQLIGDDTYKEAIFGYTKGDVHSFNNSVVTFLGLFDDLESILATSKDFLLGVWLNSAKNASDNDDDRKLFEYNARNQITLWGPNAEIKDYATKQWAGMVGDLFKARWKYFLETMLDSLINKSPFNETSAKMKIFTDIEEPFTFSTKSYREEPIGDTIEVAKDIYNRWWPRINCDYLYLTAESLETHGNKNLIFDEQVIIIDLAVEGYWYYPCDVCRAWDHLLQAADTLRDSSGYRHDLVDLTRQVIQLIGDETYKEAIFEYTKGDVRSFNNSVVTFLGLFDDLESILATSKDFLLGVWLNSAKNASDNDDDRKLFEYNARNQITLWGPNGEIKDYATKQWAGMVGDLFKARWKYFLETMLDSLINKSPFNETSAKMKIFTDIEEPFTFSTKSYPEEPIGDTIEVAKDIYNRWWPRINCDYL